jgi:hypothetical protein
MAKLITLLQRIIMEKFALVKRGLWRKFNDWSEINQVSKYILLETEIAV